jgi:hypothetical protein
MDLSFNAIKTLHDNRLCSDDLIWQRIVTEEFPLELIRIVKNPEKKKHFIYLRLSEGMSLELADNIGRYISGFGYKEVKIFQIGTDLYTVQIVLDFSK